MQIICRSKIEEIRLKNYNSVDEFFLQYEEMCNDYITAGGILDKERKIRYLIKASTQNYSSIGDFLDIIPQEKQTVEYVKAKIKEKSIKKQEDKKPSVNAFATKTHRKISGACFVCNKLGHKQSECWFAKDQENNQQNKNRNKFTGCQRCWGGRNQRGSNHGGGNGRGGVQQRH